MTELIWDVLLDAVSDTLRLVPFLFLTYLVMEYLEHKTQDTARQMIRRAGKLGPLIGGIAGAFPQCGFSSGSFQPLCRRCDLRRNSYGSLSFYFR